MKIRLENKTDYNNVEKLQRNSFWNIYRPGAYEHYIIHKLRKKEYFIKELAFVIEKNSTIIGNINYSIGSINYKNKKIDAVVLGPLAIDKKYQNKGLGTQLIKHTLKLAEEYMIPFIIVIGDENYYSRFGFESASKYNLYMDGSDLNEENPFFMIKIFDKNKISYETGIFQNPEVFNVNEDEVDEFDKQFEFKKKLILESQLGV